MIRRRKSERRVYLVAVRIGGGISKNPSCCNPQAKDNEPMFPGYGSRKHVASDSSSQRPGVAAEGRLSTSTIRD